MPFLKKSNPKMRLIFYAPDGVGCKDGAAKSSPLKTQVSRFLIPDKTH
jgi:hypothetical protein